MTKKFKKPLGKWIKEEEEVTNTINVFNPKTGQLTQEEQTTKKKVDVVYEKRTTDYNFCKDFEHEFYIIDHHKYVVKCKNCPIHHHIQPGIHYIDKDGHVRLRSNDMVIY